MTEYHLIGFNRPALVGNELAYIRQALENAHISGDGPFTKRCHAWLEERLSAKRALLTHSCTAALEMAAILAEVGPGDEVIMPSYTFVSTANAFVLRGAVPIFVDVRVDTLNLDEGQIEAAITSRTKAICAVHYAGVACDMDSIVAIANRHGLLVIEDAAQALLATYKGQPLGTIGALGALSFHETKNLISGEGGALIINDPRFIARAEVIREKGTNRSQFLRGEADKYTWMDIGSSYLPSDMVAAFLLAQFEQADRLAEEREGLWRRYHDGLAMLERDNRLRRPHVPEECGHNAHLYAIRVRDEGERTALILHLQAWGVNAPFHYVPLHTAPAGSRFGQSMGELTVTSAEAAKLVRLPLWYGMGEEQIRFVLSAIHAFFAATTS